MDGPEFDEAHNRLAHSERKTTQQVYVGKPRRAQAGTMKEPWIERWADRQPPRRRRLVYLALAGIALLNVARLGWQLYVRIRDWGQH
jgi:hypothetical protein